MTFTVQLVGSYCLGLTLSALSEPMTSASLQGGLHLCKLLGPLFKRQFALEACSCDEASSENPSGPRAFFVSCFRNHLRQIVPQD